ncbi:MAG: CHAT domain-containing protein [Nostoc sp.]|uniref:CHAT domain-containing tetratricopeptide repeat protein n=1 Tax=Nostoc sp. TaxID=1180 RepID=UPI002FFA7BFE
MNEQRLQAYYQLIQTLLECPSGEEPEILSANTELLDADFVQVVVAAAEHFAQQGEENTAEWLRNLATYLTTPETTPMTEEDVEIYEQFILEILQATAENNGDGEVIYPLLAANTNKLNHIFAELLRRWATNTLVEAEPDTATYIAAVIGNFSVLISNFPLGSKASNMEIAITGYEIALTVYTRRTFPVDWATAQNNLGLAYSNRILGERAENIEHAIAAYSAALEVRTRIALPQQWATTQNNLGNAYSERILGERAKNVESAIAAYFAALKVRIRSVFPVDWAMTENNLGTAYTNRILGERKENIESAIAAYTAALEVLTRNTFPGDWATAQNNLGNAYINRILGEKAKNIESAIAAYSAALEVYTHNTFPADWGTTQNNLGNAYINRILGERAENIESAIAAYTNALEVRIRTAFPVDWAMTQNNLGNAYGNRILGERAKNIESAVAAFTAALEVYTRSTFPEQWAMMQNNLGLAYSDRILGERAKNIESAITAYSAALQVLTRSAFPVNWAAVQNNLGSAYSCRILGKRAENIESAIAAYTNALEVRTRSTFPVDWAMTQNNLGRAYFDRDIAKSWDNVAQSGTNFQWFEPPIYSAFIQRSNKILGERAKNIENAIAAYSAALQVLTHSAFPQLWASVQMNLGNAYRYRIFGEQAKNIESAIAAYTAALQVYTCSAFPQNYAETLFNLGSLYQGEKQFRLAYNIFADAVETVEYLRGEIISGDENKRKQAEEWNKLYLGMVETCLELSNIIAAIEYIERSKTRNLVELILLRDSKTIFSPEVITLLEQLRDKITSEQYQLQNGKAENATALAQHLQQLRQQRQKLQDSYLPIGSGFKFDQFKVILDDSTVIIEWYITTDKIIAFVIKSQGQKIIVVPSQTQDLKSLIYWTNEYLSDYYNSKYQYKVKWQNQLEERLKKLAEILHLEEILTHIPKHYDRLILIPHRFLHLFPLHALPVKESYLIDLFSNGVSYAPSCQILQQVQLRQHPDFKSLFAIQTPTTDLYEKDLGAVAAIKKQFADSYILKQDQAKKSAIISFDENPHSVALHEKLLKANCAFVFCHGYFNRNSPLDSGLLFADSFVSSELVKVDSKRYIPVPEEDDKAVDLTKCLTLADIITHVKLEHCRLVTLSACETGVIDSRNTSDEYIGLPSGFLLAGSTNVVSSLWSVDATATALLMIKFYEELQQQSNIVLALNTAQRWLRNTSVQEFRAWLRKSNLDEDWQDELDEQFLQIQQQQGSTTKIFESPFYWSAFCAIGKGV